MGNAGLGTTTLISSLVQNYNSHQPLGLVFSWSLAEEEPSSSPVSGWRLDFLPGLPGQAGAVAAQQ